MDRTKSTYTELETENAQLHRRVTELENLVRGLTQQLAEVLRSAGQQKSPPAPGDEVEGRPEAFA